MANIQSTVYPTEPIKDYGTVEGYNLWQLYIRALIEKLLSGR